MSTSKPKLFADTVPPIRRDKVDELFLVTIEAAPEPGSDGFGEAGGAFVTCWVNADDLRSAESRAIALVEQYGWRPTRFESWEFVSREDYVDREPAKDGEPELMELFEQTFVDGEVCIFYTWPIDAPDA